MSKIFTVVSGKGGAGKSTFCSNIGISLAEQKKKILLIDGDAGLRSLDLLLSVDSMVVYDWLDIIENRCDFTKARLFYNDYLQVLPAPLTYPDKLTKEVFLDMLGIFSQEYDYIIIDSPAGIGELPLLFASCSDSCIVVSTPDEVSARSACVAGNALIKLGIKEDNLRLIINRFDEKAVKKGQLLNIDDMIDRTYIRLLGIIPEDRNLMYSSVAEKKLSDYSDTKNAFSNIALRILGKDVPILL
jgi:septum site-determining protein MinD